MEKVFDLLVDFVGGAVAVSGFRTSLKVSLVHPGVLVTLLALLMTGMMSCRAKRRKVRALSAWLLTLVHSLPLAGGAIDVG